jgi:preprotein translocase subunit Sec63
MTVLTEETATGKTWIRTNKITIFNELDSDPYILWGIEKVIDIGGETIKKHLADLTVGFNPDQIVNIRNPETGELTGGMTTKGAIYALIYSAFWQDAIEWGIVDAV